MAGKPAPALVSAMVKLLERIVLPSSKAPLRVLNATYNADTTSSRAAHVVDALSQAGLRSTLLHSTPGVVDPAVVGPCDVIIADLGISLEACAGLGITYRVDEPLDMRLIAARGTAATGPGVTASPQPADIPGDDLQLDELPVDEHFDSLTSSSSRPSEPFTAATIVNSWPAWRIRAVLETYGGAEMTPKIAATIAGAICAWRGAGKHVKRIRSTLELRYVLETAADLTIGLREAVDNMYSSIRAEADKGPRDIERIEQIEQRVERRGFSKGGLWVDTKGRDKALTVLAQARPRFPGLVRGVFQALRIAVNDELGNTARLVQSVPSILNPGGLFLAVAYQPQEGALLQAGLGALAATHHGPGKDMGWAIPSECPLNDTLRPSKDELGIDSSARSARLYAVQKLSDASGQSYTPEARRADAMAARTTINAVLPRVPTGPGQLSPTQPLRVFTSVPRPELRAPTTADKWHDKRRKESAQAKAQQQ